MGKRSRRASKKEQEVLEELQELKEDQKRPWYADSQVSSDDAETESNSETKKRTPSKKRQVTLSKKMAEARSRALARYENTSSDEDSLSSDEHEQGAVGFVPSTSKKKNSSSSTKRHWKRTALAKSSSESSGDSDESSTKELSYSQRRRKGRFSQQQEVFNELHELNVDQRGSNWYSSAKTLQNKDETAISNLNHIVLSQEEEEATNELSELLEDQKGRWFSGKTPSYEYDEDSSLKGKSSVSTNNRSFPSKIVRSKASRTKRKNQRSPRRHDGSLEDNSRASPPPGLVSQVMALEDTESSDEDGGNESDNSTSIHDIDIFPSSDEAEQPRKTLDIRPRPLRKKTALADDSDSSVGVSENDAANPANGKQRNQLLKPPQRQVKSTPTKAMLEDSEPSSLGGEIYTGDSPQHDQSSELEEEVSQRKIKATPKKAVIENTESNVDGEEQDKSGCALESKKDGPTDGPQIKLEGTEENTSQTVELQSPESRPCREDEGVKEENCSSELDMGIKKEAEELEKDAACQNRESAKRKPKVKQEEAGNSNEDKNFVPPIAPIESNCLEPRSMRQCQYDEGAKEEKRKIDDSVVKEENEACGDDDDYDV